MQPRSTFFLVVAVVASSSLLGGCHARLGASQLVPLHRRRLKASTCPKFSASTAADPDGDLLPQIGTDVAGEVFKTITGGAFGLMPGGFGLVGGVLSDTLFGWLSGLWMPDRTEERFAALEGAFDCLVDQVVRLESTVAALSTRVAGIQAQLSRLETATRLRDLSARNTIHGVVWGSVAKTLAHLRSYKNAALVCVGADPAEAHVRAQLCSCAEFYRTFGPDRGFHRDVVTPWTVDAKTIAGIVRELSSPALAASVNQKLLWPGVRALVEAYAGVLAAQVSVVRSAQEWGSRLQQQQQQTASAPGAGTCEPGAALAPLRASLHGTALPAGRALLAALSAAAAATTRAATSDLAPVAHAMACTVTRTESRAGARAASLGGGVAGPAGWSKFTGALTCPNPTCSTSGGGGGGGGDAGGCVISASECVADAATGRCTKTFASATAAGVLGAKGFCTAPGAYVSGREQRVAYSTALARDEKVTTTVWRQWQGGRRYDPERARIGWNGGGRVVSTTRRAKFNDVIHRTQFNPQHTTCTYQESRDPVATAELANAVTLGLATALREGENDVLYAGCHAARGCAGGGPRTAAFPSLAVCAAALGSRQNCHRCDAAKINAAVGVGDLCLVPAVARKRTAAAAGAFVAACRDAGCAAAGTPKAARYGNSFDCRRAGHAGCHVCTAAAQAAASDGDLCFAGAQVSRAGTAAPAGAFFAACADAACATKRLTSYSNRYDCTKGAHKACKLCTKAAIAAAASSPLTDACATAKPANGGFYASCATEACRGARVAKYDDARTCEVAARYCYVCTAARIAEAATADDLCFDAAAHARRIAGLCQCVAKTCTPARGPDAGTTTHYPADGSLTQDGHGWCFVSENCPTTMKGNDHSCAGAKFAFTDGYKPAWSKDKAAIKAAARWGPTEAATRAACVAKCAPKFAWGTSWTRAACAKGCELGTRGATRPPFAADPRNGRSWQCVRDGRRVATYATYHAALMTPAQKALVAAKWPGKPASYFACADGCGCAVHDNCACAVLGDDNGLFPAAAFPTTADTLATCGAVRDNYGYTAANDASHVRAACAWGRDQARAASCPAAYPHAGLYLGNRFCYKRRCEATFERSASVRCQAGAGETFACYRGDAAHGWGTAAEAGPDAVACETA